MIVPLWMLLGFAAWTLVSLILSVGVYRWSRILTGRATMREWRADERQGSEWYRRAMRAHKNCVENLPVFTVIVVAVIATDAGSPVMDALAVTVLVARICHTTVHLAWEQTELVAGLRFAFFLVQVIVMTAMGIGVAMTAL